MTATTATIVIPCDDRCMFAKGDDCDCECQGVNHKRGSALTELQRTIFRTRVGRRVGLLTAGTPEWDMANAMLEMRDEDGMTQKDIAAELGVSGPTVRRYITRLLLTLETFEDQEEAVAA